MYTPPSRACIAVGAISFWKGERVCVCVRACVREMRGGDGGGSHRTFQSAPPERHSDMPTTCLSPCLRVSVSARIYIYIYMRSKRIDSYFISAVKRRVLFVENKKTKK